MNGGIMRVSLGTVKFDKIFLVIAKGDNCANDAFWVKNILETKGDVTKLSICNNP